MINKVKQALRLYKDTNIKDAIILLRQVNLNLIEPILKNEVTNVLECYDSYNSYEGPDKFDIDSSFHFSFFSLNNTLRYMEKR